MKNLGSVYTSWALKLARSCPAVRALPASDRWHGHHLIDGTPKDRCLAPSWLPTMSWIYFLEVSIYVQDGNDATVCEKTSRVRAMADGR
ncbi:unnamed protein product [Durusdinium trenchii]|uniref:Uncharacterized protein n=1 Tax=Durusdinium trenchii TaxID=1381693 RepID=A0ABP0QH12_9DINO